MMKNKRMCLVCVGGLSMYACAAEPDAESSRPAPANVAGRGSADPGEVIGAAGSGTSDVNPVLPSAGSGAPIVTTSQPTGSCRPGHYIGSFTGDYHSGAWFGGEETINFTTSDVDNRPGFEFWLEKVEVPCMPGQEFCAEAIVKGGKLRGFATPFSDPSDPNSEGGLGFSVRFEIDLTGELDCRIGKFKGRLENGCYDILSVLYRFDGTIDGDYTIATSAFTTGAWQVQEKLMPGTEAPASPLGGSGTWTADFADDSTAPTGPGVGLCSGETGFDTEL